MLTKEQIRKVSRLADQTGEFERFDEPNFDEFKKRSLKYPEKSKHMVKLNLIDATLPRGGVVIQKG